MSNILVNCTKAAKQTKSGWVFDIVLPDGQTAAVWAGPKTDINQFAAVGVGTTVEVAVGNTPGKYFFNKIAAQAPAGPPAPQHPFQAAPQDFQRPAPAARRPQEEVAKEMALLAAAIWNKLAEKTADCAIQPGPEELQKLVVTILIGSRD